MKYIFNDGGREKAGYKGNTGDCAVRAIAIVAEKPYQEIYDAINEIGSHERTGKRKRGKSNSRTGVYRKAVQKYLERLGWKWTPLMFIGQGCKIHLKEEELPLGRIIVSVSKHYMAIIDRVVHDSFPPDDRNGTRCVYGYFSKV